jgi:hypothetical protein
MFNLRRIATRSLIALAVLLAGIAPLAAGQALAAAPAVETYFICPTVSTHDPNGMWVIGQHGGYYVYVPTQGGAANGSKVYLTIPVSVASTAQIPAGWALYKDLPNYPNFIGMAGLLQEGIDKWFGAANVYGWTEGVMVVVSGNGDGTYTVVNAMNPAESIIIDHAIPLASAAVW